MSTLAFGRRGGNEPVAAARFESHGWGDKERALGFGAPPARLRALAEGSCLDGHRRTLPDFLVIGAAKSGTTSLYRYLCDHPCVRPAARKEIDFFTVHHARGVDWYRAHFPLASARRAAAAEGRPFLTGDATPYNLVHPHAPARARALVPDVRLLVVLRDPVERAWSHYRYRVRQGLETLGFEEALDAEAWRVDPEHARMLADAGYVSRSHQLYSYQLRGWYGPQLARWRAQFPADQMLVLRSERLFDRPHETMAEVFAFLGLPPHRAADSPVCLRGDGRPVPPGAAARLRAHFADGRGTGAGGHGSGSGAGRGASVRGAGAGGGPDASVDAEVDAEAEPWRDPAGGGQ